MQTDKRKEIAGHIGEDYLCWPSVERVGDCAGGLVVGGLYGEHLRLVAVAHGPVVGGLRVVAPLPGERGVAGRHARVDAQEAAVLRPQRLALLLRLGPGLGRPAHQRLGVAAQQHREGADGALWRREGDPGGPVAVGVGRGHGVERGVVLLEDEVGRGQVLREAVLPGAVRELPGAYPGGRGAVEGGVKGGGGGGRGGGRGRLS